MGTIDPPPGGVIRPPDTAQPRERSIWEHPFLIIIAAVLLGWGAYRAGQRASAPADPPKASAEERKVPSVLQPQEAQGSALPSAAARGTPGQAPPTPAPVYLEERRGAAKTVDAKPGASEDGAASLQAMQAEEKHWRDRAVAARARLEKAQVEYDKVSAMNTVSVMGQMNQTTQNDYAVAMAARNAALTPYQMELDAARADLDGLPEACRKAGCSPGWIR